jgi:DNA topoisomerase-1
VKTITYKKAPVGTKYAWFGVDSKGRRVRLYSKSHSEAAKEKKFNRLKRLESALPKIEQGVEKDLQAKDPERREAARVTYIMLKTGLRPGSEKDTKAEQQAYGVTTLKKDQVSVKDHTVRFRFIGKKGVKIDKIVKDNTLAKIVQEQKKLPGQQLFEHASDASVRRYVRKFGAFKPKDFRTLRANVVARKLVRSGKSGKVVYEGVAKELHNTPGVSKSAYVDDKVFA